MSNSASKFTKLTIFLDGLAKTAKLTIFNDDFAKLQNLQNRHFSLMALQSLAISVTFAIVVLVVIFVV